MRRGQMVSRGPHKAEKVSSILTAATKIRGITAVRCNGFAHLPVKEKVVGSTPITAAKRGGSTIGVVSRLENGVGASLESSNPSPSATITIKKIAIYIDGGNCPVCEEWTVNFEWQVLKGHYMWVLTCSFKCMLMAFRHVKTHKECGGVWC